MFRAEVTARPQTVGKATDMPTGSAIWISKSHYCATASPTTSSVWDEPTHSAEVVTGLWACVDYGRSVKATPVAQFQRLLSRGGASWLHIRVEIATELITALRESGQLPQAHLVIPISSTWLVHGHGARITLH
jgi:hypothetical protein